MTIRDSNALDFFVLELPDAGIPIEDLGFPSGVGLTVYTRQPNGNMYDLSREASNVQWADERPGGFGFGTLRIPIELWKTHPGIRRWDDLVIKDGDRSRYEGRIEVTRRVSGRGGDFIEVEAFGWQRHASDNLFRGIHKVRKLRRWKPRTLGPPGDTDNPTDLIERIIFRRMTGETLGPMLTASNRADSNSEPVVKQGERFRCIWKLSSKQEDQRITKFQFRWKAKRNSSTFQLRVRSEDQAGTVTEHYANDFSATEQNVEIADFPDDTRRILLDMYYVTQDDENILKNWVKVYGPDDRGPVVTVGIEEAKASRIIREVCDRVCPRLDLAGVTSTEHVIDHLDYTVPTEPRSIFDEMTLYAGLDTEEEWTWAVLEKRASNGKYRLLFEPIEQDVAYEVHGAELEEFSFDASGQFNKAIVQYIDADEFTGEVVVTRNIDDLEEIDITRTLLIGPVEVETEAQAERIGLIALRDARLPIRSGKLSVVGNQVLDAATGQGVPFYALEPGKYIRLPNARLTPHRPNEIRQNNVFLIRRVECSLDTAGASLILDNNTHRLEHVLARMQSDARRPRRRAKR